MKSMKLLLTVFVGFFLFIACQKELSFEAGNTGGLATGTLKDSLGNCTPVSVFGMYVVDSTLNANHYVLIQANFTTAGVYRITTNFKNGFSFSDSGSVATPGPQTIKLKATGKPTRPIPTEFDVQFGTSSCKITVTVIATPGGGGGGAAVYTLTGSGGTCSNANVQGTYTAGIPLSASNIVILPVNVTAPGTYSISTIPVNGITFAGSGSLSAAGAATITLTGSGTPANARQITIPITAGTSNCAFPVTVTSQGGGSAAAFTLVGSPGPCTNANVQGTYIAGTALTGANKVTIQVNVTTAGSYTITSAPVNGMTFSRSGTFTNTGAQSVDLQGTGTPTAGGNHQFPIVAGTSGCAFTVSVNPPSGGGGGIPTAADSAWSFNQGSLFFFGPMDTAFMTLAPNVSSVLIITGSTYHTIDSLFYIHVLFPGSTIQPGTYSTSNNARFVFSFNGAVSGIPIYIAEPTTSNAVMSVVITSYNSTTRIVQGTFSGNALNAAGAIVPITNGKFRATVGQ